MIISYKTQILSFNDDINNLLCQIDLKLAKIAEGKWMADRYGAKICFDENTYFMLNQYRSILYKKAMNSCCLINYSIDDIISNIKQYLTSGVVQKFKNTSGSNHSSIGLPESESTKVAIIYEQYGTNIVHYNTFNKYITQTVVPESDENEW